MKKRALALILVCLMLAAMLSACGDAKESDLTFTNNLSVSLDNIYLSLADSDEWNEPVASGVVTSGSSIGIDFSKVGEGAGPGTYDFGVIDENAMNYDLYEVELKAGDKIALSGNAESAIYTITHADGSKESYDALIYTNADGSK